MDATEVRARIQRFIADGFLPRTLPRQTWGGRADGSHVCAACGEPIERGEMEIEADCVDGNRRFFHEACHRITETEREGLRG